jgi:DNA-binding MarR family transcriptional regulator
MCLTINMTDDTPIPVLLRDARGAYGAAIRRELAEIGIDDMPRNGPFILGGMANHGYSARELLADLGISKQAASQLVDTLVLRGYLERREDPDDRRRMTLEATERGRAAAVAVRAGIKSVDARLSPAERTALRTGLVALASLETA